MIIVFQQFFLLSVQNINPRLEKTENRTPQRIIKHVVKRVENPLLLNDKKGKCPLYTDLHISKAAN